MGEAVRATITRVLLETRDTGTDAATSELAAALYPELRRIARRLMARERADHTLRPTALVNEAFVKLVDQSQVEWQDRAHFLGVAARVMRQILVDHARRRSAAKRGADVQRVTFDEQLGHGGGDGVAVLELHDALDRLAALDPRTARVVELRVFGGLSVDEAAGVLGVSKRTIDSEWAVARMWLARELR